MNECDRIMNDVDHCTGVRIFGAYLLSLMAITSYCGVCIYLGLLLSYRVRCLYEVESDLSYFFV
jgi:hypothetical protein